MSTYRRRLNNSKSNSEKKNIHSTLPETIKVASYELFQCGKARSSQKARKMGKREGPRTGNKRTPPPVDEEGAGNSN